MYGKKTISVLTFPIRIIFEKRKNILEVSKMNKKDLLIVSHLRRDGRTSLTELSKKTRIPISTIFDRLKQNKNNFIKKHTALIDFAKLGYNTRNNEVLNEYLYSDLPELNSNN